MLKYTDVDFRKLTGFHKSQLSQIAKALKIPNNVANFALTPDESFFIFLVRLRNGCNYSALSGLCNREISTISKVVSFLTCYLYHIVKPKLAVTSATWLPDRLTDIDRALVEANKSIEDPKVVAFIGGTHMKIARPYNNTQHGYGVAPNAVYSGHKRTHILKYQAVTTPDGICVDLAGPSVGSQYDSFMFMYSGLYDKLNGLKFDNEQYKVYGGPAYRSSDVLVVGYKGQMLTQDEKKQNKIMATSRVSVEWFFGAVKNNFCIFNSSGVRGCGAYFLIATFLTNIKHCLEGSQASKYFQVVPPTLEEYMDEINFPKFFDDVLIDPAGSGCIYSMQQKNIVFDHLSDLRTIHTGLST
ncbi:LAFA_0C02960g1_1 [Lachancea sp. 'fantastica']|nr:LAFA_0C02960g1_1 [Lachancea sp. 'fantastica']